MKYFSSLLIVILPLIFSCNGNRSGNYNVSNKEKKSSGKVIAIIDGDTYDIILEGNKIERVRMDAIDAPENGMPFYKVAKNYLSELCFQKEVRLVYVGIDQHGRSINRSFLTDGTDLSKEMLKNGLAWHYKKYSSDKELAELESQARYKKIGLWVDKKPMEPWLCRKLRREGNSVKFLNDTIVIQPTK
jgi:endonuclease YncB( thermonuclease family)